MGPLLTAQLAEKGHAIDALSAQLAEKEHAIDELLAQLTQKDTQLDWIIKQQIMEARIIHSRYYFPI